MNIVDKLVYALNRIPNRRNAGPKGESTYALLSEYDLIALNAKDPQPLRGRRFDSAVSVAFSVQYDGDEPTEEELLEAMFRRYLTLKQNRDELREACEIYDTMEIDS